MKLPLPGRKLITDFMPKQVRQVGSQIYSKREARETNTDNNKLSEEQAGGMQNNSIKENKSSSKSYRNNFIGEYSSPGMQQQLEIMKHEEKKKHKEAIKEMEY